MEKRNLFQKIFGVKKEYNQAQKFKLINSGNGSYYAWNGNMMDSDIVRSCIRPKANAVGKLTAKHIYGSGETLKVNSKSRIKAILEKPNEYESMQDFLMKMVWQRELYNNAFAYVKKDNQNNVIGIYALLYSSIELYKVHGDIFIKFNFSGGQNVVVPYDDVIHIRKDYAVNDFYGADGTQTLNTVLEVIGATDKSVVNAVNSSNTIRWLLKYATSLRPEALKKNAKEFIENYLSTESETIGAAAVGSDMEAVQVKPENFVPNAAQMDRAKDRLYSYFGVNKNIVQNDFTEDQWQAFYEQEIEPIALQLSNAFTNAFFTEREKGFENRITFEASALNFANMSTKLKLVQLVDRASMTPNELRAIMNLSPIEGGDKPLRRKDTGVVSEDMEEVKDEQDSD